MPTHNYILDLTPAPSYGGPVTHVYSVLHLYTKQFNASLIRLSSMMTFVHITTGNVKSCGDIRYPFPYLGCQLILLQHRTEGLVAKNKMIQYPYADEISSLD